MHFEQVLKEFDSNQSTHNLVNSQYGYDHMVYVRLFEGCNLNCEHCFIPANPKKIDSDFYENLGLTNELVKHARIPLQSRLYLQWHGGEPTLLGADYLRHAIEEVQKDERFYYMHGIQTNLMNFHENTENWVKLYQDHFDSQLGISWDYSIRHVRGNRYTPEESSEVFEDQFWKNVALAQQNKLDLYMVVTATRLLFEHFKNPFDFFEMMVEKNITKLNFERVTKTGYARSSWEKIGLSNAQYSHYMSRFFKAYIMFKQNNPMVDLSISPFDGLLRSVVGLKLRERTEKGHEFNFSDNKSASIWDIMSYKNQGYGCWSGECDTRFHTIDSNGYKHGCTALTSEQDNKNRSLQQSISVQSIKWIGKKDNTENQKNTILAEREVRQQTCQGCEFLSICSSGCLSVEKFDESGECSGAKELFKTIRTTVSAYLKTRETNEVV